MRITSEKPNKFPCINMVQCPCFDHGLEFASTKENN